MLYRLPPRSRTERVLDYLEQHPRSTQLLSFLASLAMWTIALMLLGVSLGIQTEDLFHFVGVVFLGCSAGAGIMFAMLIVWRGLLVVGQQAFAERSAGGIQHDVRRRRMAGR
jgi:hypothetical protein